MPSFPTQRETQLRQQAYEKHLDEGARLRATLPKSPLAPNDQAKRPYYDVNDEHMLCQPHAMHAIDTSDRAPRMTVLNRHETDTLHSLAGGQELCADCISDPQNRARVEGLPSPDDEDAG
jgi:hypothetical protein